MNFCQHAPDGLQNTLQFSCHLIFTNQTSGVERPDVTYVNHQI